MQVSKKVTERYCDDYVGHVDNTVHAIATITTETATAKTTTTATKHKPRNLNSRIATSTTFFYFC